MVEGVSMGIGQMEILEMLLVWDGRWQQHQVRTPSLGSAQRCWGREPQSALPSSCTDLVCEDTPGAAAPYLPSCYSSGSFALNKPLPSSRRV